MLGMLRRSQARLALRSAPRRGGFGSPKDHEPAWIERWAANRPVRAPLQDNMDWFFRAFNSTRIYEAATSATVLLEPNVGSRVGPYQPGCLGHGILAVLKMSGKLKGIYDALDHGNYKNACKLCATFLQKQPSHSLVRALHAIALERCGRKDEAVQLCQDTVNAGAAASSGAAFMDETCLNTLQVAFRRCRNWEAVAEMYEAAYNREPDMEEYGSFLFYTYNRLHQFAKAQQVATKMYAKFKKVQHLLWVISSILLQVRFGGPQKMLDLAAMMLQKAPLGLDGLQDMPFNRGVLYLFFLHLSTLQLQKKQAEAIEMLEAGKPLLKLPSDLSALRVQLLWEAGRCQEAVLEARAQVIASPGSWASAQDYARLVFDLPSPDGFDASKGHTARFSGMLPSVVSFEELESNWTQDEARNALLLFRHLQQVEEQGQSTGGGSGVNRVAFLGELELRRCALARTQLDSVAVDAADVQEMVRVMSTFVQHFAGRAHCFFDMKPHLACLSAADASPLLSAAAAGEDREAAVLEARLRRSFRRTEGMDAAAAEQSVAEEAEACRLVETWIRFGGGSGAENKSPEALLQLAVVALIEADRWSPNKAADRQHLLDAVVLAQWGLTEQKHAFGFKVLLLLLYNALGLPMLMFKVFSTMAIKNIQVGGEGQGLEAFSAFVGHSLTLVYQGPCALVPDAPRKVDFRIKEVFGSCRTLHKYKSSSFEMLQVQPPFSLDDKGWRIAGDRARCSICDQEHVSGYRQISIWRLETFMVVASAGVHVQLFALLLCSFQGLAQSGAYAAVEGDEYQSNLQEDLPPPLKEEMHQRLADLKNKMEHDLHVISESGTNELRGLKDAHIAEESKAEEKFRRSEERSMQKQAGAEETLQHKLEKLKDAADKEQARFEHSEQERLSKLKKEYDDEKVNVLDKFRHEAERAQTQPQATSLASAADASEPPPVNKSGDWWKVLSAEEEEKLRESLEQLKEGLQDDEDAIENKTQKKLEAVQDKFSRKEKKAVDKLTKKIEKMQKKEVKAKEKLQQVLQKLEEKSKSTQKKLEEVGPEIVQKLKEEYGDKKSALEHEFQEKAKQLKKEEEEKKKEEEEKAKREEEREEKKEEEVLAKQNTSKPTAAPNATKEDGWPLEAAQSSRLTSSEPGQQRPGFLASSCWQLQRLSFPHRLHLCQCDVLAVSAGHHSFGRMAFLPVHEAEAPSFAGAIGLKIISASALLVEALVRTQPDGYEGPPPPDEVAQAYALLNLPLSALRSDVQRRSRALARERHPDKAPPDQRVRATRLFRQLQDAKEIILSWLQQRNVPVLDESDDSPCLDSADECEEEPCRPPDVVFGEAGDVLADFDQDGSGGESAQEDEKAACVYKGRGDSPDTVSSSESGDEKAETALALRSRGIVRTEDSALVQATALSHFMASQRRRPQEMCSECFQRKVSRGSDLCSECHDEISQLRKCLKA
ncbi:NAA25 [Symbiodinium sp. CCMP2456]|nr:NAA25 [Symbiodinium sp. CCMP2456]